MRNVQAESADRVRWAGGRTRRLLWAPVPVLAIAFTVLAAACGSSTTGQPATTSRHSTSVLKRIVVGDLSFRVPAEWRSVDFEDPDLEGVYMSDPGHEPSNAVTFSDFYAPVEELDPMAALVKPDAAFLLLGETIGEALKADQRYSAVRDDLVIFPSGITAYELRFNVDLDDETFTGVKYVLVTEPRSGARGHVVTYEAIDAEAGHMAQFRASARSIKLAE